MRCVPRPVRRGPWQPSHRRSARSLPPICPARSYAAVSKLSLSIPINQRLKSTSLSDISPLDDRARMRSAPSGGNLRPRPDKRANISIGSIATVRVAVSQTLLPASLARLGLPLAIGCRTSLSRSPLRKRPMRPSRPSRRRCRMVLTLCPHSPTIGTASGSGSPLSSSTSSAGCEAKAIPTATSFCGCGRPRHGTPLQ